MKLSNMDKRQILHSARGKGEIQRQSNFDKPAKRVERLIDLGLLLSATKATDMGCAKAREIIEEQYPGGRYAPWRDELFAEIDRAQAAAE